MEQKVFDEYLLIMEFMNINNADSPLLKKYKESWDSLMPVVSQVFNFMENHTCETKGDEPIMIFYHNLQDTDIDTTYKGVINFIKNVKERKIWQP